MGENFRFGKGAKGDPEFLGSYDEFETRVVPLVEVGGRDRLLEPHPRPAWRRARWQGAPSSSAGPFLLEGEVVPGDSRGRELGMPTANIVPDDRYACPATASTPPGRTATRRR